MTQAYQEIVALTMQSNLPNGTAGANLFFVEQEMRHRWSVV